MFSTDDWNVIDTMPNKGQLLHYVTMVVMILIAALPAAHAANTHLVQDRAEILSPEAIAELLRLTHEVQQQTTAEVMVMTVPSLYDVDIDAFATNMFNQIGIGRKETNNGLLFLIAPNDRRTRIEVGYGLEPLFTDALAGDILDTWVIPRFKQNDIEGGVLAGTKEIARILKQYPEAAKGVPGSTPLYVRTKMRDFSGSVYLLGLASTVILLGYVFVRHRKAYPVLLLYFLVALVGAAIAGVIVAYLALENTTDLPIFEMIVAGLSLVVTGILNLRQFRRFRPRQCQSCSGPMHVLAEQDDDKHLNEVQRLEERLGSVDYDVWYCPACLKADTERYVATFTTYSRCPKCKAQTLQETVTTLVRATTSSTGSERVDTKCVSCAHTASEVRTTPRLSSSSSSGGSGGGSSGGGSSGGGGASRSW